MISGNGKYIVWADDSGIIRYNLETHEQEIVSRDVNGEPVTSCSRPSSSRDSKQIYFHCMLQPTRPFLVKYTDANGRTPEMDLSYVWTED